MLIYRKDLVESPPTTWDELEETSRKLRAAGKPFRLLLETKTYDTLLCTALELSWGHGAFMMQARQCRRPLRLV